MFDVPLEEKLTNSGSAVLPVEERRWNAGLFVGPSGAGKTTLARTLSRAARDATGKGCVT
ncbi:hypothetical protein GCM10020216_109490 [Nonomuraea helvata]